MNCVAHVSPNCGCRETKNGKGGSYRLSIINISKIDIGFQDSLDACTNRLTKRATVRTEDHRETAAGLSELVLLLLFHCNDTVFILVAEDLPSW